MINRRTAGLVRWWVEMYTRGLPADVRDARRDEIASDLWYQLAPTSPTDGVDRPTDLEIFVRLVLGIRDDVGWRLAASRVRPVEPEVATSPKGARVLGLLAIFGGMLVAIGAVVFAARILGGATVATWNADPIQTSIMVAVGTGGLIAIVVATTGLAIRYRHLVKTRAVVAASAAGVGAVLFLVDVWPAIYLMPVGFAYLIWDLSRIGVLPRWVAVANIASTLALFVPMLAMAGAATVGLAIVLVIPYWITWLGIGESLLHGARANQGA